jgi:hypothetical protein
MGDFARMLLLLMLQAAPKASPYSFEPVSECGTDPKAPTCELARVCDERHHFRCKPPRWSASRGAWVRVETAETRIRRFRPIAETIARAALMQTRCRDRDGSVVESCEPAGWPEGPSTLALAALTTAVWESGMREDIQYGHPPVGRGTGGEACPMQMMPAQILAVATWIPKKERRELAESMTWRERRDWGARAVLEGPNALYHCFVAGMNHLARARRSCQGRGLEWSFAMWSRYGTGKTCAAYGIADDFALKRARTLGKFRRLWAPKDAKLPAAVRAALELGG